MSSIQKEERTVCPAPRTADIDAQQDVSLWDRLRDWNTLWSAWLAVRRNGGRGGVDGVSTDVFERSLKSNLSFIQSHLAHYRPLPYLRIYTRSGNGKTRALDVPCIRDRVVLRALLAVLSPVTEPYLSPSVFGFRRGTGAQAAIQLAEGLIQEGKVWVFRSDIQDFFSSIDHSRLMRHLRDIIPDEQILWLIEKFLEAGIRDRGVLAFPRRGIAQGSCLSPLLSNNYLMSFDNAMRNDGYHMLRYADDIVVLSDTRAGVQRAASLVCELLADLELALNRAKTSIAHISHGVGFLGFVLDSTGKRPNADAITRLETRAERISRNRGIGTYEKAKELRQLILGWLSYFGVAAGIPAGNSSDLWVPGQTRSYSRPTLSHCPLPRQLGVEISAYLDARARLRAAADEVRHSESRLIAQWKDNPRDPSYLWRVLRNA